MTTTFSPLRPAHLVPVPEAQRLHRRTVVQWALSGGLPLHRDALAAVVDHHACRHGGGSQHPDGPGLVLRWTCADVAAAGGPDLAERWCDERGVTVPPHLLATVGTYLEHLGHFRLLARGSDPLTALRAVLVDVTGARPEFTRRLAHPSGGGRVLALPRRG